MLLLPPRSLVSEIPSYARLLQSNGYFDHFFSWSFLMTGELTEILTFLQDKWVGESRYNKKIILLYFWMEDYRVSFTVWLQSRQKIDNTLDSNILQLEAQTLKIQVWKNGFSNKIRQVMDLSSLQLYVWVFSCVHTWILRISFIKGTYEFNHRTSNSKQGFLL